jgi:hypothetical protein
VSRLIAACGVAVTLAAGCGAMKKRGSGKPGRGAGELRRLTTSRDIGGVAATRVTASAELDESSPTWSPDGQWIAYAREGPSAFVEQVMLTKADGSCARALIGDATHHDEPLLSYGSPAWRPERVTGRQTATCR